MMVLLRASRAWTILWTHDNMPVCGRADWSHRARPRCKSATSYGAWECRNKLPAMDFIDRLHQVWICFGVGMKGGGHVSKWPPGGVHRWATCGNSRSTAITIGTFDEAHKSVHAHLTIYARLAAPPRYMWICPFLSRTLTNPELESPYRGQIPTLLQTTYSTPSFMPLNELKWSSLASSDIVLSRSGVGESCSAVSCASIPAARRLPLFPQFAPRRLSARRRLLRIPLVET